ncbi:hypothetical protein GCM10009793_28870 [Brachybacterium phenoliresistens]
MESRPHATPGRAPVPGTGPARASSRASAASAAVEAAGGLRPGRRTLMAGMAAAVLGGHAALTAQSASAAYPGPGIVTGDVTDVHDPEIIRTAGGTYLLPSTGDGISLRTSTDRTRWTAAGAAFPGATPWADPYTGGSRHLWAPEIHFANGQFYLCTPPRASGRTARRSSWRPAPPGRAARGRTAAWSWSPSPPMISTRSTRRWSWTPPAPGGWRSAPSGTGSG